MDGKRTNFLDKESSDRLSVINKVRGKIETTVQEDRHITILLGYTGCHDGTQRPKINSTTDVLRSCTEGLQSFNRLLG